MAHPRFPRIVICERATSANPRTSTPIPASTKTIRGVPALSSAPAKKTMTQPASNMRKPISFITRVEPRRAIGTLFDGQRIARARTSPINYFYCRQNLKRGLRPLARLRPTFALTIGICDFPVFMRALRVFPLADQAAFEKHYLSPRENSFCQMIFMHLTKTICLTGQCCFLRLIMNPEGFGVLHCCNRFLHPGANGDPARLPDSH